MRYGQESDGTPYYIGNRGDSVEHFFQELRLVAEHDRGHWLFGVNDSRDETRDEPHSSWRRKWLQPNASEQLRDRLLTSRVSPGRGCRPFTPTVD